MSEKTFIGASVPRAHGGGSPSRGINVGTAQGSGGRRHTPGSLSNYRRTQGAMAGLGGGNITAKSKTSFAETVSCKKEDIYKKLEELAVEIRCYVGQSGNLKTNIRDASFAALDRLAIKLRKRNEEGIEQWNEWVNRATSEIITCKGFKTELKRNIIDAQNEGRRVLKKYEDTRVKSAKDQRANTSPSPSRMAESGKNEKAAKNDNGKIPVSTEKQAHAKEGGDLSGGYETLDPAENSEIKEVSFGENTPTEKDIRLTRREVTVEEIPTYNTPATSMARTYLQQREKLAEKLQNTVGEELKALEGTQREGGIINCQPGTNLNKSENSTRPDHKRKEKTRSREDGRRSRIQRTNAINVNERVIKIKCEGENNFETLLKRIKTSNELSCEGIHRIRKSRGGDILMDIVDSQTAQKIAGKVRELEGVGDNVMIMGDTRRLVLKKVDPSLTEEQIKLEVEKEVGEAVRIVFMTRGIGETHTVCVELPSVLVGDLKNKEYMYIGWSRCQVTQFRENRKCYRCGRNGHVVLECKERDKCCYKCWGQDHLAKNCQNGRRRERRPAEEETESPAQSERVEMEKARQKTGNWAENILSQYDEIYGREARHGRG